jgi:hypothetical protein
MTPALPQGAWCPRGRLLVRSEADTVTAQRRQWQEADNVAFIVESEDSGEAQILVSEECSNNGDD